MSVGKFSKIFIQCSALGRSITSGGWERSFNSFIEGKSVTIGILGYFSSNFSAHVTELMKFDISAVILTMGDRPEALKDSIHSIRMQQDNDVEVIVVWNGIFLTNQLMQKYISTRMSMLVYLPDVI